MQSGDGQDAGASATGKAPTWDDARHLPPSEEAKQALVRWCGDHGLPVPSQGSDNAQPGSGYPPR
jgi:hypothetical protein